MDEPNEDDVVEQGGTPPRLPGWARRPRWLPAPGGRPSRGVAILGIAVLIVGLAGGYALGYRHPGQAPGRAGGTAAGGGRCRRSLGRGRFRRAGVPGRLPGAPAYSSSLGIAQLSGLAQTGGACSVQHGQELQLGVEVINLSDKPVTLGQASATLPHGGLRLVSQQWAPCGALSSSWQAPDGGMIVFVKSSTGVVEVGSATREARRSCRRTAPPGSAPPSGCLWRARARCRCSSVSATRRTGGRAPRSWRDSRTWGRSPTPGARGKS